jgi:hypothetical protein
VNPSGVRNSIRCRDRGRDPAAGPPYLESAGGMTAPSTSLIRSMLGGATPPLENRTTSRSLTAVPEDFSATCVDASPHRSRRTCSVEGAPEAVYWTRGCEPDRERHRDLRQPAWRGNRQTMWPDSVNTFGLGAGRPSSGHYAGDSDQSRSSNAGWRMSGARASSQST